MVKKKYFFSTKSKINSHQNILILTWKYQIITKRNTSHPDSFSPYCIIEWNELDNRIRKTESVGKFKTLLRNFFKVKKCFSFSLHDPIGIKLVVRRRFGFSHLNKRKFWLDFRNTVSAMCGYGSEIGSTQYFLLRCFFLNDGRKKWWIRWWKIKTFL